MSRLLDADRPPTSASGAEGFMLLCSGDGLKGTDLRLLVSDDGLLAGDCLQLFGSGDHDDEDVRLVVTGSCIRQGGESSHDCRSRLQGEYGVLETLLLLLLVLALGSEQSEPRSGRGGDLGRNPAAFGRVPALREMDRPPGLRHCGDSVPFL